MQRHLLIAGTGRTGTTALVKLLDACGLETRADSLEYFHAAHAGLETNLEADSLPYVLKNPYFSEDLRAKIEGGFDPRRIEAIIVPIRDLDYAVSSRIKNFVRLGGPGTPGGLWRGKRPGLQRSLLAEAVYVLLATAAEYQIRVVLLSFPRFVNDGDYAWDCLNPLLAGVDRVRFLQAHDAIAAPDAVSANLPRYSVLELRLLDLLWLWRLARRKAKRQL